MDPQRWCPVVNSRHLRHLRIGAGWLLWEKRRTRGSEGRNPDALHFGTASFCAHHRRMLRLWTLHNPAGSDSRHRGRDRGRQKHSAVAAVHLLEPKEMHEDCRWKPMAACKKMDSGRTMSRPGGRPTLVAPAPCHM